MFKRTISLSIAMAMVLFILAFAVPQVQAAEQKLEAKITNMVEAVDRNGNAYIRFIVEEQKMLQGVKYTVGIPVMAFGANVEKARTLKIGDTINAIVQKRTFNSRDSYTILAWL